MSVLSGTKVVYADEWEKTDIGVSGERMFD